MMTKFQCQHFGELDRASAPGLTLWAYRNMAALLADIMAIGFFDPADHELTIGDHILVSARDGAAHLWVRRNVAGHVMLEVLGTTP